MGPHLLRCRCKAVVSGLSMQKSDDSCNAMRFLYVPQTRWAQRDHAHQDLDHLKLKEFSQSIDVLYSQMMLMQ